MINSHQSSVLHLPGGIAQEHLATGSQDDGHGDQGSLELSWRRGRDLEG